MKEPYYIILAKIDLNGTTIRIVNDIHAVVHKGEEYLPYPFKVVVPQEMSLDTDNFQLLPEIIFPKGGVFEDQLFADRFREYPVTMTIIEDQTPDRIEAGPFDVKMKIRTE